MSNQRNENPSGGSLLSILSISEMSNQRNKVVRTRCSVIILSISEMSNQRNCKTCAP